jgi:hypothetical protein
MKHLSKQRVGSKGKKNGATETKDFSANDELELMVKAQNKALLRKEAGSS